MTDDFDPRDDNSGDLFDALADAAVEHDVAAVSARRGSLICVLRIALAQPAMPHPDRVQRRAAKRGLALTFDCSDRNVFTYQVDVRGRSHDVFVSIAKQTLP